MYDGVQKMCAATICSTVRALERQLGVTSKQGNLRTLSPIWGWRDLTGRRGRNLPFAPNHSGVGSGVSQNRRPQLFQPPGADPHAGWCGRGSVMYPDRPCVTHFAATHVQHDFLDLTQILVFAIVDVVSNEGFGTHHFGPRPPPHAGLLVHRLYGLCTCPRMRPARKSGRRGRRWWSLTLRSGRR
jgi:hypothetical protein